MNSLRFRIAAVLVASILCVVFLATLTMSTLVHRLANDDFIDVIGEQLSILTHIAASTLSSGAAVPTTPAPAPGEPRDAMTKRLQMGFDRRGEPWSVVVTHRDGQKLSDASIELTPGRWLRVPVRDELEPPLRFLAIWMGLIFLGTAGLSLAVAHRVTRPLVLLEAVASDIGPDGHMQPVPETGPAEVKATARALNQLNHNLRQAVESRMRLVAAAGHDLRTPMTRMRLRAEFLDDSERSKWLSDLDELDRIADSAIRLVREEVEQRNSETIRLDDMAQAIFGELNDLALPVVVRRLFPVLIVGAPLALTRAFRNLIINAALHGGGAEISVEMREGRAVMVIEDRGPGIPEDLLDRVFEPFFRVDPSRRQSVPGAGLGLAIAREIIARAGGTLSLRNREGGGLRQEAAFPRPAAGRDLGEPEVTRLRDIAVPQSMSS